MLADSSKSYALKFRNYGYEEEKYYIDRFYGSRKGYNSKSILQERITPFIIDTDDLIESKENMKINRDIKKYDEKRFRLWS